MPKCFVIQPFDRGEYDKRYEDVLKPAIEDAELEPYRVDEDPSATVLIDDIEKGIRDADICLADISTNNPNIWYEVGYAIANDKSVVLICAEPRPEPFPFDIRHRHITKYLRHAPSDFAKLRKEVTERLKAQAKKAERVQTAAAISQLPTAEGLSPQEIAVLGIMIADWTSDASAGTPYGIKEDMRKAGYTKVAASLTLESLRRKEMIEFFTDTRFNGEEFTACRLTPKAMDWLLNNQNRFYLTRDEANAAKAQPASADLTDDDIPF